MEAGQATIGEIQQEVIDEFALFDDWMSKYEYLIEMGRSMPAIDEEFKKEEFLVKGCQSKVWLNASMEGGRVRFRADSDAVITKGIIALLIRVLGDQPPGDISEADLHFIDETGLRQHLSPNRSNGLVNMVKQMKRYARAFVTKEKQDG